MKFGHPDGSGGFVLFSCWQMEAATPGQDPELPPYEWEKEFWNNAFKHRGEAPMPIMVKDKPFWRGVYPPIHKQDSRNEECVYVADFDLKIYKANPRAVRLPTDAEYNKHFKKYVDQGIFFLSRIGGTEGFVMRRRYRLVPA